MVKKRQHDAKNGNRRFQFSTLLLKMACIVTIENEIIMFLKSDRGTTPAHRCSPGRGAGSNK